MRQIKVIVEKNSDGYSAYPLGVKGVVVGQGDSYEGALAVVRNNPDGSATPLTRPNEDTVFDVTA